MKLIVGLGNVGKKYTNTRHNIGFTILDVFAVEQGLNWKESKDWLCFFSKAADFVLVKPTTLMNGSGQAVAAISKYFEIGSKEILVVHDDVDLEFGKIRLSFNGSSAGHKGVESINNSLATEEFARLRVGVGRPKLVGSGNKPVGVEKYVLTEFDEEQKKKLPELIAKSQEAIQSYLDDGIGATMNKFN